MNPIYGKCPILHAQEIEAFAVVQIEGMDKKRVKEVWASLGDRSGAIPQSFGDMPMI